MKTITLTQGKIALIDDEDFEKISKHKWCVYKRGNIFYAMRSTRLSGGKQYDKWTANIKVNEKQIYLGRFALEIEAAHAYDDAALKYFGEFANLNFSFGS